MKNIHWLVPYKINHNQEILNSNIASIRLRSGLFTLPIFKDYKVIFCENINNIWETLGSDNFNLRNDKLSRKLNKLIIYIRTISSKYIE